ncbi:hypothetical protein QUB33_06645, partial [Microcoleus sp. B3-A4]
NAKTSLCLPQRPLGHLRLLQNRDAPNQRFVDNGKIITSGGIAAGIDMSLHVVGQLLGTAQAEQTAEHMEYKIGNW